MTLIIACVSALNAMAQGTWEAPAIPAADITTSNSGSFAIYNVEADAFMGEGMRFGTEAIACRLEGGYAAGLANRQKFTLTVNNGTVKMVHANHTDRGVGCANANAYEVWADYGSNNVWTFTASTKYAGAYKLTQTNFGTLDVASKWGGKLTVKNGKGYTDWAFIPEGNLTNGSFAKWVERKALYDVYAALVESGTVESYTTALQTANNVYTNNDATVAQLRAATRDLLVAASSGIYVPVNASALFTNANMQQDGVSGWTSTGVAIGAGVIEKYHSAITLTQTQNDIPQGLYTVLFHGMVRQDGSDAAPKFTATCGDYVGSADVPFMNDLVDTWGVANGSEWVSGMPNQMWRAAEGLAYEEASAKIDINVDANQLKLNVEQNSTTQWFVFNSFDIIFQGPANLSLYRLLRAQIDIAEDMLEEKMSASASTALNSAYETATALDANDSEADLQAALDALSAANSAATTSITAYTQIKARLDVLTTPEQLGSIPVATAKEDVYYTNYTNGNYENVDEVLPLFKTFVQNYWSTNTPAANADLTGFIINQGLAFGDATGWSGGGVNQGNIEWYNGNYDVNQTLSDLPNGTYKLQAQGYYRPGGNGNTSDAQNALLYGGAFTSPVVLIASEGKSSADATNGYTTANTNSGSTVYVPNSQADAAKVFANTEAYNNEVTFVVSNGTVKIGFKKNTLIQNDWTCFDNFRLIYVSADAQVAPELVDAPMNAGIRAAQQTALETWTDDNTMENYQALLDAIDAAQASADKYVIINERIPKLAGQSDKVTVEALTAKYTSGEYVEADDVFTEYRSIIATYYASNAPADNADLTEFIINPSFEFGDTDGWTHNSSNDTGVKTTDTASDYRMTNSEGSWLFNTWSSGNPYLYIEQELTGLPQGTYELSATFAAYNDTQIEFTAENVLPDGTINEDKLSFTPYDTDSHADANYGIVKTLRFYVTDGTLKIGGHAYKFFKCDNFQLKFISTDVDEPDLTQPMNRYERENYIAARDAYDANPTQENLRELIDRKLIVENSIEAYVAANSTLRRVQAMMSKTNVYTFDAYFTIDDMYRKYGNDPENGVKGLVYYETLEDDVAFDLERMFFGSGYYRNYDSVNAENPVWQGDIPAVPFIASAWDCGNDGYAYRGRYEGDKSWKEGDDYYANTWSTEGKDDGTNMLNPYLEYWLYGDALLAPKTMTATVDGTPGAEYTVKMFVRVRTIRDNEEPVGMTIQIGDGTEFTPNWQYVDNESSYYVLNNRYRLWYCDLWEPAHQGDANDPSYTLPTGDVDSDGKLRIKFHIKEGSNVTWLSMKDVYVNFDNEDLTGILAQLKEEVNHANANYYVHLGFDPDEYAPYTNVEELIALKRAQQVYDASENYFLVKAAYDKLYGFNHGGENNQGTWTKNTEEMNGFYWTNDYTSEDVKHVEWYGYEDDCITPSGWELIGREDGFSTGIVKLGVNSDAEGLKAIDGETGLQAKYETEYGEETGYTLPLKAGVKYIMTFTYAYAGEGTCPETRVSLSAPSTGVDNVLSQPLTTTTFTPLIANGDESMANWYMYRATFVPAFDADYVILFDKDNVDPEPVIMGELTLVRYKEDAQLGTARLINGTNQNDYSYTPDYVGGNFQVTRPWNNGAYNTLVLPFKLSGNELKAALGENFDGKVYYYTGATYTGGESYYTLNFEERESGIFANVPVLIWSAANSPLNPWVNQTFEKTVTKYVKNNLTVDTDTYDLVGTYETIKIPAGASYLTPDNTFKKSTGKANLAATRAYFIPLDAAGNIDSGAKLMGFNIDDVPTGIIAVEEDGELRVTSGNIYSVDGRLIRQNATTLEGLPRGTYVVDGKKYMVK